MAFCNFLTFPFFQTGIFPLASGLQEALERQEEIDLSFQEEQKLQKIIFQYFETFQVEKNVPAQKFSKTIIASSLKWTNEVIPPARQWPYRNTFFQKERCIHAHNEVQP